MDFEKLAEIPMNIIILGTLITLIKWLKDKIDNLLKENKEEREKLLKENKDDRDNYINSIKEITKVTDGLCYEVKEVRKDISILKERG